MVLSQGLKKQGLFGPFGGSLNESSGMDLSSSVEINAGAKTWNGV